MRGWGVVAVLACACGNGGGSSHDGGVDGATIDGTSDALVDAPPTMTGARVGLVALGVRVPVLVKLVAGTTRRQVLVSQDGTFYFPGRFDAGVLYTLSVDDTRCRFTGDPGMVGTTDVSVQLYCHGIVELDALQLPSALRVQPAFDPGAFVYTGKRPYLMDGSFPVTLTASAAYPTEATIRVSAQSATSDQAITVPYGTGIEIEVTHASGVPPALYTIAPSNLPLEYTFTKGPAPTNGIRFSSGASGATCVSDDNGSLAISGDLMVVGAACPVPGNENGGVHIFRRSGWVWTPEQTLTGPEVGSQFGAAVALDGDTLIVGAPFKDNPTADRGAAYVYKRANMIWTLEATLAATSASDSDHFGWSVAIAGNLAAVGAPHEDSNATGVGGSQTNESAADAGAVYLFTRSGTTWSAPVYIKPTNTGAGDEFGDTLALDGTTLVVGALNEDGGARTIDGASDETRADAGAAYVFDVAATPVQQAYLKASNADAGDFFGWSVAIDGDTVIVGAPFEDSDGSGAANNTVADSGAAYVFVRSGTSWSEQAYLKGRLANGAIGTRTGDLLGKSVAIAGNAAILGAGGEGGSGTMLDPPSTNTLSDSGAVFISTRSGTTWANPHYLKAPNSGLDDHFGIAVAADGDTFAVGAPSEDSNLINVPANPVFNEAAPASGAVYVFR